MSAATFRPGDQVFVVGGPTCPPEYVGERGVVVEPTERERLLHHTVGPMVELDDGTRTDFFDAELEHGEPAPSFTVRPVAEASTGSLTFTLVAPDVVGVTNEYGDTVRYPLRDVVVGLLGLWAQTSRDDAVVGS